MKENILAQVSIPSNSTELKETQKHEYTHELLTALKDAADALVIHAPDSWVLTQARAAIAKAEGEAA